MMQMLNPLRPALAVLLAFMVVAVDFTSYLLSVIGDAFFVGALLFLAWPTLKASNQPTEQK